MHRIIHPDILIEFLPAQCAALHAERDLLQEFPGRVGETRVFRSGKAEEALVVEFEPDAAALDPAADGDCGGVSGHEIQCWQQ